MGAALLAPLAVAQPTGADPGSTAGHVTAAATMMADHSVEMPQTARNEVIGDFDNGYLQRALVEMPDNLTANLNVYDTEERGGALVRSTPSELVDNLADNMWDSAIHEQARANGLHRVSLAWSPDALYMAGLKQGTASNFLYRLPSDGSCTSSSCIDGEAGYWSVELPSRVASDGAANGPTAIAVGQIGTTSVVAVGLANTLANDTGRNGVLVFNQTDGSFMGSWQPVGTNGGAGQIAVTALDWDDNGSGLLAVGTTQSVPDGVRMQAVRVSVSGSSVSFAGATWFEPVPGAAIPSPLSAQVAHRANGSPVIAFGMDDGSVKLWDPATTSPSLLSQAPGSASAPVDALTFTDRLDGTVGLTDLVAVSSRGNTARVLRYSGATTLAPLPVTAGGGTTTDVGGIRAWFPGYKTGYLQIRNSTATGSAIQLDFAARPNASYGCWFFQDFDGYPALPTSPVIIEPNDSAPVYTVATLTAGEGGDCAATDFTGQWAAYVTITQLDRPADRTVAKLVWSRTGELTVQSVGGSLGLVLQQDTGPRRLGSSFIEVKSPPPPGAPASLNITGTRLDPAGTDYPVYRFDVAATTWPLPVSNPPRAQTVLPPLRVVGKTANGLVTLGLLVPQGQPSRATSGSVTLSPVSFYWQNSPDVPEVTDVFLEVGTDLEHPIAISPAPVNLAGLPVPAAGTAVSEVVVCPTTGSTTCDGAADPVANGLDQAKLRIQIFDANTQVLPLTDPLYGKVYYRDENGDLLTGLIPEDGSAYVRVSPYAGAYPNDGSNPTTTRPPTTGTVGGRFGYLSTTTTDHQEITPHVPGYTGDTQAIIVEATDFTPQVQPGAQAGPGFYIAGCHDYSGSNFCRLAQISTTKPGLFLTTDPDTGELRIGLQFATAAQTSLTSLPLQQLAGQPEHTVAARPLTINNGEVHLNTTAGFQPADSIDTWLVSHGTQIEIRDVKVGGGN
jgi:hypothetical protein